MDIYARRWLYSYKGGIARVIDFYKVVSVTIPEGAVTKIIAADRIWCNYKNLVYSSIDVEGSIYNGCGYKEGYRVRSGGAELAVTDQGSCITGHIPVQPGDIVRLTGWNFSYASVANAVNFYNLNFTNLGQFTQQPASYGIVQGAIPEITVTGDIYMFTIPDNKDISYIRVTGNDSWGVPPQLMVVTVNQEIT